MGGFPDDATLEALFEAASHTRSQALRFDPEAPGGFRVLTAEEDRELIDALRLPAQRYADDREHLLDERDTARRIGDLDAADTADAHLEVLAAERRLAQRHTPGTDDPGIDGRGMDGPGIDDLEIGDEEWER